jgi:predicted nucleotidyltransferase
MRKHDEIKPKIDIPLLEIENFCLKNHIQTLALFGSVLTERFRKSSDVDILVQFDSKHIPGLIRLSELELELGEILWKACRFTDAKRLESLFSQRSHC